MKRVPFGLLPSGGFEKLSDPRRFVNELREINALWLWSCSWDNPTSAQRPSHAIPLAFKSKNRYHHPLNTIQASCWNTKGLQPTHRRPHPWLGPPLPEALLLIYKLGQHGVRTAVKVQRLPDPRERKNSPRDTQSHVLIFFFFFLKTVKRFVV